MTSLFQIDGLLLTGAPGDTFADFYRSRVRFAEGARLYASDLATAYRAWCDERSVANSSDRAVRAFMETNGHKHRKSSVIYYADAMLGDFEGKPMSARTVPVSDSRPVREAINVTIADLDQTICDLQAMRRRLARMLPPAASGR